jgi:hypothetical protein
MYIALSSGTQCLAKIPHSVQYSQGLESCMELKGRAFKTLADPKLCDQKFCGMRVIEKIDIPDKNRIAEIRKYKSSHENRRQGESDGLGLGFPGTTTVPS